MVIHKNKSSNNLMLGVSLASFFVTIASGMILTSSASLALTQEKSARIEVRNACSMESEVSNAHTATVSAGSYKDNIGTTVVSVVCNDNAGFAVYAIGFTNDTDGTTTMNGLQGGTIATGLAKQGNTSSWSMKLSTYDNDAYAPTIENDYDDYNVVPDDYTMVASYPAAATSTNPSSFKTSYAAYVSIGQAVDTYTGQVKYVLVHPSNGEAPEKDDDDDDGEDPLDPDPDISKSTNHPCMDLGDGTTCDDTDDDGVGDTLVFPANSLLRAYEIAYTNAGKPMYIEDANTAIGWRPMVASDYATVGGKEVRFAIQDIEMTLDGTINGTKVCAAAASSTANNSYIDRALVMDLRDGTSYNITKAPDNRCWLTDNLALDPTDATTAANMSSSNTNATDEAIYNLINGNATALHDGWSTVGVVNSNMFTNSESIETWTKPLVYTTLKDYTSTTPGADYTSLDPLSSSVTGDWKYGAWYNICSMSAGTYCFSNYYSENSTYDIPNTAVDVAQDICPAGWRVPTEGATPENGGQQYGGEAQILYGSYSGDNTTGVGSRYANYRIAQRMPLVGRFGDGSRNTTNVAWYWSSTYYGSGGQQMFYSNIADWGVGLAGYLTRYYGGSVRCIAK